MLNSLTYGWWTDKNLYITDPDHVVLGEKADQGAQLDRRQEPPPLGDHQRRHDSGQQPPRR
jgi:hypothetical protein